MSPKVDEYAENILLMPNVHCLFDKAIVTDNIWEFQIHCKLTQHFQNFDFEHLKVFKIHHSGRVSLHWKVILETLQKL